MTHTLVATGTHGHGNGMAAAGLIHAVFLPGGQLLVCSRASCDPCSYLDVCDTSA